MTFDLAWLALAIAATIAVRIPLIAVSARNAVDHFYWILAARAFRAGGSLPIIIREKYLLEEERQAYPPFFGWMLAWFPDRLLADPRIVWLVQAADALVLAALAAHVLAHHGSWREVAATVAVVGTAPVLVAYNTQLASRAFGNVFLVIVALATAGASLHPMSDPLGLLLWLAAIAGATGVVLTHKMTLQLMIVLCPLWAWALGDARVLLLTPIAILAAAAVTGFEFARLQWRAHIDIIKFWHAHNSELGAHLFKHSPVYGDYGRRGESTFHQPGWRGGAGHALLAFSYGPLVWLAPLTLLWGAWPAAWLVWWLIGTLVMVLATLYVPSLRCFGGGHLYMFNAIAPAALWWNFVLPSNDIRTAVVFAVGAIATLGSLALGYRRRAQGGPQRNEHFQRAIDRLAALPADRIAVFPLIASEEVAYRTPHAVLWGGHSLGFRQLTPVYPVVRMPIGAMMQTYGCRLLLVDTHYWSGADRAVEAELPGASTVAFGTWRLVTLSSAQPRQS